MCFSKRLAPITLSCFTFVVFLQVKSRFDIWINRPTFFTYTIDFDMDVFHNNVPIRHIINISDDGIPFHLLDCNVYIPF